MPIIARFATNITRMQALLTRLRALLGIVLLLAAPLAWAQLSIEITGAGAPRMPIAIAHFPGEEALAPGITSIVRADLERSGLFRGLEVPPLSPAPTEASSVNYAEWRSRLADALVLGSVAARPDGRYEVRFRLYDVVKQASPGGRKLAYVSFENKKPVVYVHSLLDGKRNVVANFRGSNSAPAWSPDGSKLAVTLSREGGSQIFLLNADGSSLRRLTSSAAIDTEPRFSGDGQWIYFTSDRGGTPQIYRMPAAGGEPQRVTFEGSYNVTPRLSPDGKTLAYITLNEGKFQVALLDLSNRQVQIITDSDRDESPSFAPNGRMILLATVIDGRGVLSAVSSDGRVKQRLSVTAGDVREPAWGPFTE